MSEHTPGPWIWSDNNRWGFEELKPSVINGTVDGRISVDDADALLIAAAPDLLEALKKADIWMKMPRPINRDHEFDQGYRDALLQIHAAIKKATQP